MPGSTGVTDAEVAAIVDDVRARVLARRAAGGSSFASADDVALGELQTAIQDVNLNAKVNSHLPLLWEDLVVGRLRSLVQRVVRRLLRWYINPIVDQQNMFNAAAARAITLLASENARLRGQLADERASATAPAARNDRDVEQIQTNLAQGAIAPGRETDT